MAILEPFVCFVVFFFYASRFDSDFHRRLGCRKDFRGANPYLNTMKTADHLQFWIAKRSHLGAFKSLSAEERSSAPQAPHKFARRRLTKLIIQFSAFRDRAIMRGSEWWKSPLQVQHHWRLWSVTPLPLLPWPLPIMRPRKRRQRKETTSWAKNSTYLNHAYRHVPSLMVQHSHSPNGLVNSELTSAPASSSTSTSWTSPTTLNNNLPQTPWPRRHQLADNNIRKHVVYDKHLRTSRTSLRFYQANIGERQPSSTRLYVVITTAARHTGELLRYLIVHSTRPNSEPNNLLHWLQQTSISWETSRQLRHQHAAGAHVQQYTLLQSIHCPRTTKIHRDITTTAVSKMDTRHLSLWDDTSCHRWHCKGEYSGE